jgi:hypothetical protein
MQKIIKLIVFFTMVILLYGCGYKNIYQGESLIEIKSMKTTGDNQIGNKLKSQIKLISSKEGINKINLDLNIKKNKRVKEKDITEKVTKYVINLIINLELEEIKNNKKLTNVFDKEIQYIVAKNHSDTITNEKEAIKSLTMQISEEVISFLNIYFRNK